MKKLINWYKNLTAPKKIFWVIHIFLLPFALLGGISWLLSLAFLLLFLLTFLVSVTKSEMIMNAFNFLVDNLNDLFLYILGYSQSDWWEFLDGWAWVAMILTPFSLLGVLLYILYAVTKNRPESTKKMIFSWKYNFLGFLYYPSMISGIILFIMAL